MAKPASALERAGAGETGGRERRAVGMPGHCGAWAAGEGLKDLGPANPAPGAGARRPWGPKALFNFNLKKKKTGQCLFRTFPCLYRNQLSVPLYYPRAYTFTFGNKINSRPSGEEGLAIQEFVLFIGFAYCSKIPKTLKMVHKLNFCPFTT